VSKKLAYERWRFWMSAGRFALVLAFAAPAALAGLEGSIEINQVAAQAGGVTPSDGPGLPVTISVSGSYRLTGELSASGDTSGIEVLAPDVTLELGGFTVRGGRPCTGTPPQLVCPAGLGRGIVGTASNTRVVGGVVTGFADGGVELGPGALVSSVAAHHNGRVGIEVGERSRVTDSQATRNGGIGISAGDASLIHGCSSVGNLDQAAALGAGATALDSLFVDGPGSFDPGSCFADPFEPNQLEGASAFLGSVTDSDGNGASVAAELAGPGDVDWFSYHLSDGTGATPDPTLALTSGGPLRMCLFYECDGGTLALTCPAASSAATSPSGRGGCCTTSAALQIIPDCVGVFSDSGTVVFRADSGPAGQCTPYGLSWHP